jgi:hypothetical protein
MEFVHSLSLKPATTDHLDPYMLSEESVTLSLLTGYQCMRSYKKNENGLKGPPVEPQPIKDLKCLLYFEDPSAESCIS